VNFPNLFLLLRVKGALMKILVMVKANSKHPRIEEVSPGEFRVHVKAPPREGKANEAVLKALAEHVHVPLCRIAMVAGMSSKRKWVNIHE